MEYNKRFRWQVVEVTFEIWKKVNAVQPQHIITLLIVLLPNN